jgi:hypothetical protein
LELDAVISAEIKSEIEAQEASGHEPPDSLLEEDAYHRLDVINDRAAARADQCPDAK